jgi:ribosomal protein S18 acetylase RimI-like enzyme
MSTTTVELSATAATLSTTTTSQEQGLEFQVCEYDDDTVYTRRPNSPVAAAPAPADESDESEEEEEEEEDNGIRRAMSSVPPPPLPTNRVLTVADNVADTETDTNVKRVDFKDEAANIKLLAFLESRGINTSKLVQEHIIKYGSRARVAFNDDGDVVGFALFDNEVAQEMLVGASDTEIKLFIENKPFIFLQLLVVDDPYEAGTTLRNQVWSKRLIQSVTACITKNKKIGIVRVDASNDTEIELYRSCGFYTMADMGVPSYSTKKDNVEVLGFTPLGLAQTTEIFKKFYAQGARF